eukprot:CAMPEP_0174274676 /NCGR_PEP_ID=MMETSP0439-20130205/58844_1 /TAXON_ID=0 /ORGANISM="Stereomyxa ramosa, Strain Chinc5" /LENGTH=696 /DNA_ID=CAMNT_0015366603 /DNA_START=54 /DNA_END=2144 /DNA_ORIENTATION=-
MDDEADIVSYSDSFSSSSSTEDEPLEQVLKADNSFGDVMTNTVLQTVDIEFQHLTYFVDTHQGDSALKKMANAAISKLPWSDAKPQRKYLLKDLSGSFRTGEVTAIIGPSGAGKTTLLNAIAGRVSGGTLKGKVLLNGRSIKKVGKAKFRDMSGYVMQNDILVGQLTPKESLLFSAALRRPARDFVHYKRNNHKIQSIIQELGLDNCKNSRIGTPLTPGISGGQKKRVSVGIELITDPSVVFLDEPTSGLDSSTAYSLVVTLQKLANAGRTIIATIHQPSSDIFQMFDKLIVLANGHIVYQGTATGAVAYFSKLNFKCPTFSNPAEFIMNLVKVNSYISTTEEGVERVALLARSYREKHALGKWVEEGEVSDTEDSSSFDDEGFVLAEEPLKTEESVIIREGSEEIKRVKPNFLIQLLVLVIRDFAVTTRERITLQARFVQTIFVALLVGVLFFDLGNDQQSIQDRQGALFFCLSNQAVNALMLAILTLPLDKAIFIREHSSGMYSSLPYYLAKSITDIPFQIFFPFLFGTITYWMIGYQGEFVKYLIYVLCLIICTNIAVAIALCIGSLAPDPKLATVVVPFVILPLLLLGGFFLNLDSIPSWLRWAKWLTYYRFGYEIVILNEFRGLTFTCSDSERAASGECPLADGAEVIDILGMDNPETKIWINFLILLGQLLVLKLVGFLSIKYVVGRQRG